MHFPNLVFLPKSTHLTAVALFQVAVKGEWRYFWRLYCPQQDMAGRLLALAVGGGARVLLPVLLGHVLRWKVLTGVLEFIKAIHSLFSASQACLKETPC